MQIASSAKRTCRLLRSASLYTATVRIPNSRQAEITRSAISPRFAINTLRNIANAFLFPETARLETAVVLSGERRVRTSRRTPTEPEGRRTSRTFQPTYASNSSAGLQTAAAHTPPAGPSKQFASQFRRRYRSQSRSSASSLRRCRVPGPPQLRRPPSQTWELPATANRKMSQQSATSPRAASPPALVRPRVLRPARRSRPGYSRHRPRSPADLPVAQDRFPRPPRQT